MSDDELLAGRPRLPRPLVAGVVAAVVLIAVLVVVQHSSGTKQQATPTTPTTPTTSPVTPSPVHTTTRPYSTDPALEAVYLSAHESLLGPSDRRTLRRADCRRAVGDQPSRVSSALTRQLPGFRVLAGSDANRPAGLCAVQIRAIDGHGSIATVLVVAPTGHEPGDVLTQHSGRLGRSFVQYARYVTTAGWKITAGSTGPAGRAPAPAALVRLVRTDVLLW